MSAKLYLCLWDRKGLNPNLRRVKYLVVSLFLFPKNEALFGLIFLGSLFLKIFFDFDFLISNSRLFQSLKAEGKKESLYLFIL